MDSTPKNENPVINYSPSCCSKPVTRLSSSEHKLRYFGWNPRAFWPCIDSKATKRFTVQKGSKDIVKIVHVTSVVQPSFYEAARIIFVHKENKDKWLYSTLVISITCIRRGTFVNTCQRLTRKKINCWIKSLFLFSLHTKSILITS